MSAISATDTKVNVMTPHNVAEHVRTAGNRISGQEVAKNTRREKKAKWPKTDARHWQGRVFKNTFFYDGKRHETSGWCVRIAHGGRRGTFNLGTPNVESAGGRALEIY